MATITESEVRTRASRSARLAAKSSAVMLSEAARAQSTGRTYDVFLSHAFLDAELVLGLKLKLEDYGHSVYVDWLEDPQLDRRNVTRATAQVLRQRMALCKCLLYAATENSTTSKWMPWECGYFDGKKNRAAILPLTQSSRSDYQGQEYLGVYPYLGEVALSIQPPRSALLVYKSQRRVLHLGRLASRPGASSALAVMRTYLTAEDSKEECPVGGG